MKLEGVRRKERTFCVHQSWYSGCDRHYFYGFMSCKKHTSCSRRGKEQLKKYGIWRMTCLETRFAFLSVTMTWSILKKQEGQKAYQGIVSCWWLAVKDLRRRRTSCLQSWITGRTVGKRKEFTYHKGIRFLCLVVIQLVQSKWKYNENHWHQEQEQLFIYILFRIGLLLIFVRNGCIISAGLQLRCQLQIFHKVCQILKCFKNDFHPVSTVVNK